VDHGETDESSDGRVIAFEVAHQTAIAADPGECPLDDPSLWQNDKAVEIRSLDNFEVPRACRGGNLCHFRPLIARVRENTFDERKAPPRSLQQIAGTVAVLNVGRQNAYAEQETERIDEDVASAARDLLARIEALRSKR